jgi:hypothetical protein
LFDPRNIFVEEYLESSLPNFLQCPFRSSLLRPSIF